MELIAEIATVGALLMAGCIAAVIGLAFAGLMLAASAYLFNREEH